jgi:signal transduction histidine kinase
MANTVLRIKGISKRWMLNVMTVVVAAVTLLEVAFALFIYNYYCNIIRDTAGNYVQYLTVLSTVNPEKYEETAREYGKNFEYKNKVEVQMINSQGEIFFTTNGFTPTKEEMPDYAAAKKAGSKVSSWQGRSERGERILAETIILQDMGQGSNGAIRWIVSLSEVMDKTVTVVIIAVFVGLGIIMVFLFTGLYFIKSIVIPVQEVTNTARRIAMGDFMTRLEVKDSDEIGELCDTINYMASELSHAETIKNDFISSVSHELRTPLTAINGWAETVQMSIGTDPELENKGLSVIIREGGRLSSLVEELLDFSRMQSGHLSMNMSRIDILGYLKEAVYMYEELARRQNITVNFDSPESLPAVMGDPNRLKQVFINIIDNAVKYTLEGGNVDISAAAEEGGIRITVKDTGVGIAEQDLDRVKEKFFKANKTVRGSGIGLAVADEILKQHNGLIFFESKEGVGTTVSVILPIAPEEEPEEQQPLPTEIEAQEISISEIIELTSEQAGREETEEDTLEEGEENA